MRRIVFTSLFLASLTPLYAQTNLYPPPTTDQQDICGKYHRSDRCQSLVDEFFVSKQILRLGASPRLNPPSDVTAFSASLRKYALLSLADQTRQKLLQTIATSAAVNQVGAGSSSGSASTNLAAKPTTTDFLSLAAESGAFTDTVNGTALTLQANANGLAKYLSNRPVFAPAGHNFSGMLQPLSFTVSLDIAQSSGATAPTTGSATTTPLALASVLIPSNNASFSSFQAVYMFYRPFRPGSKAADQLVSAALNKEQPLLDASGSSVADALNSFLPLIAGNAQLDAATTAWLAAAKTSEQQSNFDAFVHAYSAYYDLYLDTLATNSAFDQSALALSVAVQAYQASVYSVINDVRGTPLATFTYTFATPTQKPSEHQFTLIGSYLFKGGHHNDGVRTALTGAQFTGNFTTSIYASLPAGATYGRLRDLQVSAEFDKPVGGTAVERRAILSLAGYGQYQYDPTVLNITAGNLAPGTNIMLPSDAQVLLGTAGWLGVVQGKLVVNLRQGLSLPIAIKYSNKTDLLQANDIRGQIGLSYDLSALSKLITSH